MKGSQVQARKWKPDNQRTLSKLTKEIVEQLIFMIPGVINN